MITPYQDVLNNIIQRLMNVRKNIWSEEFGLEGIDIDEVTREKHVERLVESHIQIQEYDILVSNDWNLSLGSGEEILSQFLRFSNPDYDFRIMNERACKASLEFIFKEPYQLNSFKQSSIFMVNLKLVCQQLNYNDFYDQLKDFAESQLIIFDFPEIAVAHQIVLLRILEE